MERGFAIVTDADGKTVKSVESVSENDKITIRLKQGKIGALVTEKI